MRWRSLVVLLASASCRQRGAPASDAGIDAGRATEAGVVGREDAGHHIKSSQPGHIKREENFIDGTGITTSVVDNANTGQADVTISTTAVGGVASVTGTNPISCSPTTGAVNCSLSTPLATTFGGTGTSSLCAAGLVPQSNGSNLGNCASINPACSLNSMIVQGSGALGCGPLPGASGNVATSNGTVWTSAAPAGGGVPACTQNQFLAYNEVPAVSCHSIGGDITLSNPVTGSNIANFTVQGLQNRSVASTAPTNGQLLQWSASNIRWQPAPPPSLPATCFGVGSLIQSAANICQNIASCTVTIPAGSTTLSVMVDFRMRNPDVLDADDAVGVGTTATSCFSASDVVSVAANPGSGNSSGRTSATIVYQFQGLSAGAFTVYANAMSNTQTFTTGASLLVMTTQ
jgi:hypothetical protein